MDDDKKHAKTVCLATRDTDCMLDADRIDPATVKLSDFVDTSDPQAVLNEVKATARMSYPDMEFKFMNSALEDAVKLFGGLYPGYRRSNTKYHDLKHTMEVLLATVRLLHGARAAGRNVSLRTMRLGLLSALFHDVGLIQTDEDTVGTGAKYTIGHEKRSVNFVENYLREHGYPEDEIHDIALAISGRCSRLSVWKTQEWGSSGTTVTRQTTSCPACSMRWAAYVESLPPENRQAKRMNEERRKRI